MTTAAQGTVTLTLKTSGRGRLECIGTRKRFDGLTTLNLDLYGQPATCMVQIDGAMGAFQVYGTGSITCDKAGAEVSCSKGRVP